MHSFTLRMSRRRRPSSGADDDGIVRWARKNDSLLSQSVSQSSEAEARPGPMQRSLLRRSLEK